MNWFKNAFDCLVSEGKIVLSAFKSRLVRLPPAFCSSCWLAGEAACMRPPVVLSFLTELLEERSLALQIDCLIAVVFGTCLPFSCDALGGKATPDSCLEWLLLAPGFRLVCGLASKVFSDETSVSLISKFVAMDFCCSSLSGACGLLAELVWVLSCWWGGGLKTVSANVSAREDSSCC